MEDDLLERAFVIIFLACLVVTPLGGPVMAVGVGCVAAFMALAQPPVLVPLAMAAIVAVLMGSPLGVPVGSVFGLAIVAVRYKLENA